MNRHIRLNYVDYAVHFLSGFTDCKSADSVAVKVKLCDILHVLDTKVIVGGALIYAEKKLILIDGIREAVESCHFLLAANEPSCGALNGSRNVLVRGGVLDTFIESHSYS